MVARKLVTWLKGDNNRADAVADATVTIGTNDSTGNLLNHLTDSFHCGGGSSCGYDCNERIVVVVVIVSLGSAYSGGQ